VLLTLPIREVVPATPRARVVRIDLGDERFSYAPGQAIFIAAHGYERRKPYSIAGAPEDAERDGCLELLVGVDAEGRPGPHLILEPGALMDVEGPVGRFTFPAHPDLNRFVFVAGGTGIAPLRSMLRHALHVPHRQIGLLYSARTPLEFAYEAELKSLAREGLIELEQTVTREAADEWTGTRGRIGPGHLTSLIHDPATMCFVCGPPALVQEITKQLEELGVARDLIRVEEF
jgi:ferredoxin-NADP reductase